MGNRDKAGSFFYCINLTFGLGFSEDHLHC